VIFQAPFGVTAAVSLAVACAAIIFPRLDRCWALLIGRP
jgi:hypothetical protein